MSDIDDVGSDKDTQDIDDGDSAGEDESTLHNLIAAVTSGDESGGDDSGVNDSDLDNRAADESAKLLAGRSSVRASRDVIVIIPPVPKSRYEYAASAVYQKIRRPSSKAMDKNKEKLIEFENKTSPRTLKIICGLITIIVILGIGIGMLVLAGTFGIEDLYIIGVMFVVGGSLFTFGFMYVRCVYDNHSNIYAEPAVAYNKV